MFFMRAAGRPVFGKFVTCIFLWCLVFDPASAQESVQPTATLVFKAKGDAKDVIFHASTEEEPCKGLARVAGVYDAELIKEKLLPFVAKTIQKAHALGNIHPQVELTVAANLPLQIMGQSDWTGTSGNTTQRGRCGPFTQQFLPQAGHKYLIQFNFNNGTCSQELHDITIGEPDATFKASPLECKQPLFR